ncbi:hypothetical protein LEP1GSC178_3636 [Leptospira licerasiae str. MMD4847]|uniref:Uncharacterized protein n=1 Tax=Leptospira licerasiae str. MMD4847 TaxID=1049971 RepID=A0ABP2RHT3_9LEPT|nr:hypothetical protein LEP1GSC178_3636 [Leptospira licerasiae str. MMD4847]
MKAVLNDLDPFIFAPARSLRGKYPLKYENSQAGKKLNDFLDQSGE